MISSNFTSDGNGPRAERLLAERLRDEAIRSRPAFSEALHGRILRAVEERKAAPPPARAARRPRLLPALAATACAAAVVLAGWQLAQYLGQPRNAGRELVKEEAVVPVSPGVPGPQAGPPAIVERRPTDPPAETESLADLAESAAQNLNVAVETALAAHQTAYLDHDGRLAAEVLLAHLPVELDTLDSLFE
jgi:hypothetical protein